MKRMGWLAALLALFWIAAPGWAAPTLQDRAQLEVLLKEGGPCCVIDARSAKSRKQQPLASALPYRKGLKINPTGPVVVIADSDARALAVGDALSKSNDAKVVYAVKGGFEIWQQVRLPATGEPGKAMSFVIPKNTCEQGKPLQTLRTDKQ